MIGRRSDYTRRKILLAPALRTGAFPLGVLVAELAELPTYYWGCGYETPFDISPSFPTTTGPLRLGKELSSSCTYEIPGIPQTE